MDWRRIAGCGIILVMGASWIARGDVIEFKTGQKIEGEVLKERPDEIIVDIGVDILRIPTAQIQSRTATTKAPAAVEQLELYATAELPERNIKDLAEQFGAGVVLIQTPGGLGSGFILNPQGYCITNYHVIEKETRIAATIFQKTAQGEFERRQIPEVRILALNPYLDLALLQIPVQPDLPFRPVYLAKGDEQREGDQVFAIGNPLGLERSVSQGIVSLRNRNFGGLVFIQTTTQINPGNSGGPLFNLHGEVVGVTNMKLLLAEGLGFAIPISYVKHFLENKDAFAYDRNNPNSGYRYLEAPRRRNSAPPASAPTQAASPAK